MDADRPSNQAVPLRLTRPLRIAMLAPPWITIPAPGYGGIEAVVEQLCRHLTAAGHDVTLIAAPGSHVPGVEVLSVLARDHPDVIGEAMYEVDHAVSGVGLVEDAAAGGRPFDVVHDHSGFAALAIADRCATPMVHTFHGAFNDDVAAFYRRHGRKALLVSLSETQRRSAPADVAFAAVVPNPIDVEDWPLTLTKRDYLLWLGRVDEVKAPHRAIAAARLAGRPLVLAGPVQPGKEHYFAEAIEPHLDDDGVRYVGEVGGAVKRRWLAEAAGLLMPITWEEPFGMVMVEALACGTPVIACPRGAARDIVVDGVNGFHAEDDAAMAAAVARLGELDPRACRKSVSGRYDGSAVAAAYARVYVQAAARSRRRDAPGWVPMSPAGYLQPS
jgi:glycosyltransferase involved in cell wall biosynthesis